jgi:hypothetical protein
MDPENVAEITIAPAEIFAVLAQPLGSVGDHRRVPALTAAFPADVGRRQQHQKSFLGRSTQNPVGMSEIRVVGHRIVDDEVCGVRAVVRKRQEVDERDDSLERLTSKRQLTIGIGWSVCGEPALN